MNNIFPSVSTYSSSASIFPSKKPWILCFILLAFMLYLFLLKFFDAISASFVVLYEAWIQITLDIQRADEFSGATY